MVERRDTRGVILRYDSVTLRRHHIEQKPQPSDRERMALISAERELLILRIICDHADFSELALERIYRSLNTVQRGLEMIRSRLGLASAQAMIHAR